MNRKIAILAATFALLAFTGCSTIRQYYLAPNPAPPVTEVLVSDGLTAFDPATDPCNAATRLDCPPSTAPGEFSPPPTTEYNPAVGEEYNPAICVPASTCPTTTTSP